MKRFYFGDEEENEDEEDFEAESKFMFPDPSEFIAMTPFENPDHFILNCAIKICEKSWFWKFSGITKKTKMIKVMFETLKQLTEGSEDA